VVYNYAARICAHPMYCVWVIQYRFWLIVLITDGFNFISDFYVWMVSVLL